VILEPQKAELAEALFRSVGAGVGSTGAIHLDDVDVLKGHANA
jgi:hypothetical protein